MTMKRMFEKMSETAKERFFESVVSRDFPVDAATRDAVDAWAYPQQEGEELWPDVAAREAP